MDKLDFAVLNVLLENNAVTKIAALSRKEILDSLEIIESTLFRKIKNMKELGYIQEDLDTLTSEKFKHHIKNGEGCNKDRNKAKDLIIENFEEISEEIKSKIKKQFIYVIFSSGRGIYLLTKG